MNRADLVGRWIKTAVDAPHSIIEVQHVSSYEVDEKNRLIKIVVSTDYAASDLWYSRSVIESAGFRVSIWVDEEILYAESLTVEMHSNWAEDNTDILKVLKEVCTTYVHSSDGDKGYPCLFIQPFLGIEDRLSMPASSLVGKPVTMAPGIIGETRLKVIEKAIATRKEAIAFYEAEWCNVIWKFKVVAEYCSAYDEIVVKILDENDWQVGYWKSHHSLKNISATSSD